VVPIWWRTSRPSSCGGPGGGAGSAASASVANDEPCRRGRHTSELTELAISTSPRHAHLPGMPSSPARLVVGDAGAGCRPGPASRPAHNSKVWKCATRSHHHQRPRPGLFAWPSRFRRPLVGHARRSDHPHAHPPSAARLRHYRGLTGRVQRHARFGNVAHPGGPRRHSRGGYLPRHRSHGRRPRTVRHEQWPGR